MPTLAFTLAPEGVVRVHDALVCLAKFSDVVGLEASRDQFTLIALNSSQSAYASLSFGKKEFFQNYRFAPDFPVAQKTRNGNETFMCQLYNKALLSVFKGRVVDARDKGTSIEKCEVNIQDQPDKTECRLIIKMICRHGVKKIYKLTYESAEIMHALFDKHKARNQWRIGAHILKSFSEYFGPKTEQLDIYSEGGRVTLTSYTEKITNGNEVLKQPLQTSISVDTLDFDIFDVQEELHIGISVKDFRAIVVHAETLKTSITAHYSQPGSPFQLCYNGHGMECAFTLSTTGESRGGFVTKAQPVSRNRSAAPSVNQDSTVPSQQPQSQQSPVHMPPPVQPASRSFVRESESQLPIRPSLSAPIASISHESLFVSENEDDDERWGEKNYEEDEDELGWGASAENDSLATSFHRSASSRGSMTRLRGFDGGVDNQEERVAPTQRISQIRGLFGDD